MLKNFVVGKLYRYGRKPSGWNGKEYECIRVTKYQVTFKSPDGRLHSTEIPTLWWYESPKNPKPKVTYWR